MGCSASPVCLPGEPISPIPGAGWGTWVLWGWRGEEHWRITHPDFCAHGGLGLAQSHCPGLGFGAIQGVQGSTGQVALDTIPVGSQQCSSTGVSCGIHSFQHLGIHVQGAYVALIHSATVPT